jgi:HK97 family phage prohead protease
MSAIITRERRLLSGTELRAAGDQRKKIHGRAVVYDQESEVLGGWFIEVIRPGALTDAIKKSDVRCLFNHDANHVLGRTKSGTLRLNDTAQALEIECDPPDTQTARDLLELISRKDVDQMSFAFTIAEDRWTFSREPGKPDFREILRVDELFDVSPVTYPAYPQTEVWARTSADNQSVLRAARMRHGEDHELDALRRELELAELED